MATWRIEAELLIPGDGDPVDDGVVVLDGDRIGYAGPASSAPPTPNAQVRRVRTVMPGLWDCHGHFTGIPEPDISHIMTVPVPVRTARAVADAARLLDAGVTSVREVGGLGVHLARAVDEGSIPGPAIYGAGAVLSPTGGHADIHAFPLDWVLEAEQHGMGLGALCDGDAEVRKAVRKQLRVNARVIKICASGGVMSEVDHPIHQQFSDDELAAIVEEAARAERVVAAHCHGKPGIMAAIRAGVGSIEHGTYLDEEAARAMADTGTVLVSTRYIVELLLTMGERMPAYAYRKITAIAERHLESIRIAVDAGVTMAMGTDIFVSGPRYGDNARELSYLAGAGLDPLAAVRAATVNGPLTLGPQAPRSGKLEAGYDADVIGLSIDPLADLEALAGPGNVTHVWKAGELAKDTATSVAA